MNRNWKLLYMTNSQEVSNIYCQDTDDIVLIIFSERDTPPTHYVMLQQAMHPRQQDIKLGQDKVYIEIDDQLRSCYGGVKSVGASSSAVVIYTDDAAAKCLRISGEIHLDIAVATTGWLAMLDKICKKANIPLKLL